jgi:hypothetical protein
MNSNNSKPNKNQKSSKIPNKLFSSKNNKNQEVSIERNNYYINNKNKSEEEDKKIKEIEEEIKAKRTEKIKRLELIHNSRNKELLKLEIKVLRKLYGDLFITLPNTFKQNDLTFENFVFEFGEKIHLLFEIDRDNNNPSYDNLLKEVNLLILEKYPISPDLAKFNKKELKKYFYDLGIDDDWSLIQKYKQEMDKLEEKQRLVNIAQSMKEYYNDLNNQIETKKKLENEKKEKKINEEKKRKKIELEKIRLMNKKKIQQLKENEKMMKMMDQKKIEQINENEKIKEHYIENLEKENNNLNENNLHIIKFKLDNAINIQTKQMQNYNQKFLNYSENNGINTGYSIPDEQISSMVDQIINKKKEKINFDNIEIDNEKIDENKNNDMNKVGGKIEGINYEIEKKVNQILSEQRYKINIK